MGMNRMGRRKMIRYKRLGGRYCSQRKVRNSKPKS